MTHKAMRTAVACLILVLIASAVRAETRDTQPMNVLVILADDLGAKELACYGHPTHQTPQLDQLAAQGMRFRTCFATPICSPSRVMLMTGRYGFRTGWFNLIDRPGSPTATDPSYDLGREEITFADVLKARDYATALAGKWQLTGKIPTLIHDCGFDSYRMWAYQENLPPGVKHTGAWEGKMGQGRTSRYWHPSIVEDGRYFPTQPDDYGPDLFADFLIQFMKENRDRPFCAYFTCPLTHAPWAPIPNPDKPGEKLPGGLASNVATMDRVVGRLVRAIDELGLSENTLILFAGDNGTGNDGKGTVTELGARVPFIARCPGFVKAGVVSDELVDLTDVFPTLAEIAKAPLPNDRTIDGHSLVSTLQGGDQPHRAWVFSYLQQGRVLRDKRWLLEGDGTFYDCGDERDGVERYRDVTESTDSEVVTARARFHEILKDLPAPESLSRRNAK